MKILALFVCMVALGFSIAQEPFQENGKWGLSKYGDTSDVIFPATFDKIFDYYCSEGKFYAGLKDKMLHPLTSNEKVNEMQYDRIEEDPGIRNFVFCFRDGEMDIISAKDYNFIIRNVKADKVSSEMENAYGDNEYLITIETDDGYGIVDIDSGKVLLEAKYDNIESDRNTEEYFVITKDKKKGLVKMDGSVVFEPLDIEFEEIEAINDTSGCFILLGKKYTKGFYDSKNQIYIEPQRGDLEWLDKGFKLILISSSKNGSKLYFEGNLILDGDYDISNSDEEGYVAMAFFEDEEFYVKSNGELVPESKVHPE